MSVGRSAMVRGGLFYSNKGAPTMEGAFTERKVQKCISHNRYDRQWRSQRRCTHHERVGKANIAPSQQVAESTYLSAKTILEFNIEVPRRHYVRPADFEPVLPSFLSSLFIVNLNYYIFS